MTPATSPRSRDTLAPAHSEPGARGDIIAGRLDPSMSFTQRVWALTARVPTGRVVTYADIAHHLGTRAYRAVGGALRRNPYAPEVPCHRVVGSDGKLTGFAGGLEEKRRLLRAEGVITTGDRVDLAQYRHRGGL